MIGNEYEYILTQNDLFSRGSFLCHRAELALKCLQSADKNEDGCPTMYEIGHCWTQTQPNQTLVTSCPRLDPLVETKKEASLSRECFPAETIFENGIAYDLPMGWQDIYDLIPDIESCNDINATAPSIPKTDYQNSDDYKSSWNTSRDICLVLSFMSFLATFVSLVLMTVCLKKCTRIYIHMNLLLAFMIRTLLFIWTQVNMAFTKKTEVVYPYLKELIVNMSNYEFDQYTKVNQTTVEEDIDKYCVEHFEKEKWTILSCRLYPVLFQYIILSTYSWMCCEGLYLILLQSRPMLISARNGSRLSPLRIFNLVSWGLPVLIVGIWMGLMLHRPDSKYQCFDLSEYLYIIEVPINLLIFLSILIFIRLIMDLCAKLRAPVHINGGGNFHIRMTKATISLIPLLGIQTGVLPVIQERYGFPSWLVNLVLPLNIFLSSSQGLVVSVLYCFTSQEVKDAIIRRWYMHWEVMRINREIISRRQSRDSQLGGGGIFANLHDRLINSNSNHNQSRKDQVIVHNHMNNLQPKYDQPRPSVDHGFYSGVTHEDESVSNHRHSDVSRESDGYHSGQRSAESNQTVDQSNQSLPSYQIPTYISLIQPPPPPNNDDSDDEYEVDEVTQLRIDED